MKSFEHRPGGATAKVGAYIGTLMIRQPKSIFDGLQAMTRLDKPVDELPINNPDLVRSSSLEAAYTLTEGGDSTERREVFWRGLYLAYQVGIATKAAGWVRMRDGHPAGRRNEAEFPDIMAGVFRMQQNLPFASEVANLGHLVCDNYGTYPETARLGILTGLYFLDNGEREKRAEYDEQCRQARTEYERNQFNKIAANLEGQEWAEIARHYDEPTPQWLLDG